MALVPAEEDAMFLRLLRLKTPVSTHTLRILNLQAAVLLALLFSAFDSYATTTNQFIQLPVYSSGGTPVKMVTADFNRDGKPDVVVLNSNNVLSILTGTGNSAFAASKTIVTLP